MIGFVVLEGEWEVTGNVTDGSPATRDDPADPGEVEITEARDPDGNAVPQELWPFLDPDDYEPIEQEMAEQQVDYDFDEGDDDD